MKIAITGHTSGVGKAIYEHYDKNTNATIIGLSRATGYDLSLNLDAFVPIAIEQDLFINNAHYGYAQAILLSKICQRVSGRKMSIINMGSTSADLVVPVHPDYSAQKAALDRVAELYQNSAGWPKITTIRFGMTDTPRLKDIVGPRLTVDDIVRTVDWIVSSPDYLHVSEITMKHIDQYALCKR